MTISVGDKLPDSMFKIMGRSGPEDVSTKDVFSGKTVALFSVPGAFTPTCHNDHVPGYLKQLDAFKEKGVDSVVCLAVNDVFVMGAWSKATGSDDKITFLADGNGEFAKATGLDLDLTAGGLGLRSQRFAMVIEDGTVKVLNIEKDTGLDVSSAESLLAAMG